MNIDSYIIKPTKNQKIIGNNYPSVRTHLSCYTQEKNLLHEFNANKLIDFDFDIKFTLENGSFFCDLMSQSSIPAFGLLISKKLALFLKKFNLGKGKHKLYTAIISASAARSLKPRYL